MKLLHVGQPQRRAPAAFPARFALTMTLLLAFCAAPAAPVLADETPPAFLDKWGSTDYVGYDPGYFRNPQGMVVDTATGCLYVADSGNYRVQKFDGSDWTVFAGVTGSMTPSDVAVDSSGNVYVADSGNNRIQKFDSSGAFIREWGGFNLPQGVAVDSADNVYVSDYFNCRIQKFDSDGGYLTQWGTEGAGEVQFHYPWGIAVDLATDNVYVTDCGENHHRVQEFTSAGEFIRMWGSQGAGNSQFNFPQGIEVDSSGNIYVADAGNHRIQKFDSDGTFLTTWGTNGSLDGQFYNPAGVAVDTEGIVYVADTANWRVQSFGERTTVDIELDLKAGWNMVSVPVEAADMSTDAVFPDAEAVYTWNPVSKSYGTPATIEPERSYWVAVTSDDTLTVTGTPVTTWTDALTTGWNMVGSVHGDPVDVADLSDDPSGSVQTNAIYHWNPTTKSYAAATQIEAGLGYWMAATQGCDLTMTAPV